MVYERSVISPRLGDYVFTLTAPEPFDGELATLAPNDASSLQVVTA